MYLIRLTEGEKKRFIQNQVSKDRNEKHELKRKGYPSQVLIGINDNSYTYSTDLL